MSLTPLVSLSKAAALKLVVGTPVGDFFSVTKAGSENLLSLDLLILRLDVDLDKARESYLEHFTPEDIHNVNRTYLKDFILSPFSFKVSWAYLEMG